MDSRKPRLHFWVNQCKLIYRVSYHINQTWNVIHVQTCKKIILILSTCLHSLPDLSYLFYFLPFSRIMKHERGRWWTFATLVVINWWLKSACAIAKREEKLVQEHNLHQSTWWWHGFRYKKVCFRNKQCKSIQYKNNLEQEKNYKQAKVGLLLK